MLLPKPTFALFESHGNRNSPITEHPSGSADSHPISVTSITHTTNISRRAISHITGNLPGIGRRAHRHIRTTVRRLNFHPDCTNHSLHSNHCRSINLYVGSIAGFNGLSVVSNVTDTTHRRGYTVALIRVSGARRFSLTRTAHHVTTLPISNVVVNVDHVTPSFRAFSPLPNVKAIVIAVCTRPHIAAISSSRCNYSLLLVSRLFRLKRKRVHCVNNPSFSISRRFHQTN